MPLPNQWSKEYYNSNVQHNEQHRDSPPLDLAQRKRGYSNSSNSSVQSNFGGTSSTNSLFPVTAAYRPHPRNIDGFIKDNVSLVKYNVIGPFKRAKIFCPPPLRRLLSDPLNGQAQKLYGLIEEAQAEFKLAQEATVAKGNDSETEQKMANMARLLLKKKK